MAWCSPTGKIVHIRSSFGSSRGIDHSFNPLDELLSWLVVGARGSESNSLPDQIRLAYAELIEGLLADPIAERLPASEGCIAVWPIAKATHTLKRVAAGCLPIRDSLVVGRSPIFGQGSERPLSCRLLDEYYRPQAEVIRLDLGP
jgi:hypothetical protein